MKPPPRPRTPASKPSEQPRRAPDSNPSAKDTAQTNAAATKPAARRRISSGTTSRASTADGGSTSTGSTSAGTSAGVSASATAHGGLPVAESHARVSRDSESVNTDTLNSASRRVDATNANVVDAVAGRTRVSSSMGVGDSESRTPKFDLTPKESVMREVVGRSKGMLPKVPVLSTGMADRLAEKRAIETHDRTRRRILWAALVVLVAGMIWLFGFSKVFSLDLDQVRVSGATEYVTEQEVLDAISSQSGVPLTRVSLGKVNDDVLALKNVKSATQTRRWPNGVSITIQERVPVAAVPSDGKYELLDIDAVEVSQVSKAPKGLPIIKIPNTGENQKTLATALEILDALPADLLTEIGSITASSQDNIVFKLRDGLSVQWGNSSDTELKIEVLAKLRPIAKKAEKKTIDLSAPTFPIIRK